MFLLNSKILHLHYIQYNMHHAVSYCKANTLLYVTEGENNSGPVSGTSQKHYAF